MQCCLYNNNLGNNCIIWLKCPLKHMSIPMCSIIIYRKSNTVLVYEKFYTSFLPSCSVSVLCTSGTGSIFDTFTMSSNLSVLADHCFPSQTLCEFIPSAHDRHCLQLKPQHTCLHCWPHRDQLQYNLGMCCFNQTCKACNVNQYNCKYCGTYATLNLVEVTELYSPRCLHCRPQGQLQKELYNCIIPFI